MSVGYASWRLGTTYKREVNDILKRNGYSDRPISHTCGDWEEHIDIDRYLYLRYQNRLSSFYIISKACADHFFLWGYELPNVDEDWMEDAYEAWYRDRPAPKDIMDIIHELCVDPTPEAMKVIEEHRKKKALTTPMHEKVLDSFFRFIAHNKKANWFYVFEFEGCIKFFIFLAVISFFLFNDGWIITLVVGLYIIYGYFRKIIAENYGEL